MISLFCGLPSADGLHNCGAAQARMEARHGCNIQAERVARYLAWRNIGLGESRDLPAAAPPPNNDCRRTRRGTSFRRLWLGTPAGQDQPGGNRSWRCGLNGRWRWVRHRVCFFTEGILPISTNLGYSPTSNPSGCLCPPTWPG